MKVWRHHPVLTTGFALAVVVMLAFAVRFGVQVVCSVGRGWYLPDL